MKRILALIALAAATIVLTPLAQAQVNVVSLSLTGIETTAGGATTTVTNQVISVPRFQNVTLMTKFNFANTTTSNVVYTITRSVDNSNWSTVEPFTWTVAGNSTTPVIAITNINVGATPYLKLDSIQNTHASIVLTNSLFKYATKREY